MGINKDEAVKKIQDSKETEFEVFEGKEHATYLDNFKETVIAPKIKDVHDQYDKDIKEVTGIEREGNEKSYNYLKRAGGVLKEKADSVAGFETKVTELEAKIKDGSGDEQLKGKLTQAETDLANAKTLYKEGKDTWDSEKKTLESSHQKAGMSNILDRALMGIKFKEGMTKEVVDIVVDNVKNGLLDIAEVVEGKMIFKDKEGITLVNKDNALNPYTPEEMLQSKLTDIIDVGRKIPGTGATPKVEKDKEGKVISVNYIPGDAVHSLDDMHKDLVVKGFVQGSEEYKAAWAKYSEQYKKTK